MAKISQVDWLRARLEAGKVENQITMWREGGIGNHTGCIARLRKRYEKEGLGYDYIKTYMKPVKNSHNGADTQVAEYYIPEKVKRVALWRHGVKINK